MPQVAQGGAEISSALLGRQIDASPSEHVTATALGGQPQMSPELIVTAWSEHHHPDSEALGRFEMEVRALPQLSSISKRYVIPCIPRATSADELLCMALAKRAARLANRQRAAAPVAGSKTTSSVRPTKEPSRAIAARNASVRGSRLTPAAIRHKQIKQGTQASPYCKHSIVREKCVLCGVPTVGMVYVTGGGTHFHTTPECSALEIGQEKVRRRGGNPERIEPLPRSASELALRDPCKVCAEWRR